MKGSLAAFKAARLFSHLSFSVTDFTQKNKPNHVVWTAEYDKTFQELKLIMYSSPVALWIIKELKGLYKQTNQHQEQSQQKQTQNVLYCSAL